jgi:hypothetical protein
LGLDLEREWSAQKALWRRIRPKVTRDTQAEIDAFIFSKSNTPHTLSTLHEAQQLIGEYLDPDSILRAFDSILRHAGPSLRSEYLAQKDLIDPLSEHYDHQRAKTLYLSLLQEHQSLETQGYDTANMHERVSLRLLKLGLACVGLCVVTAFGFSYIFSLSPSRFGGFDPLWVRYSAMVTVFLSFGLLGAYVSRTLRFSHSVRVLGFSQAVAHYCNGIIFLRLIYGIFGSVCVFAALKSGLISGALFPNMVQFSSASVGASIDDIAKLLAWGFISGFSERIVPEGLTRQVDRS